MKVRERIQVDRKHTIHAEGCVRNRRLLKETQCREPVPQWQKEPAAVVKKCAWAQETFAYTLCGRLSSVHFVLSQSFFSAFVLIRVSWNLQLLSLLANVNLKITFGQDPISVGAVARDDAGPRIAAAEEEDEEEKQEEVQWRSEDKSNKSGRFLCQMKVLKSESCAVAWATGMVVLIPRLRRFLFYSDVFRWDKTKCWLKFSFSWTCLVVQHLVQDDSLQQSTAHDIHYLHFYVQWRNS